MIIPSNSTFTKEISKKFKRVFNQVQNKDNNNAQSYKTARAVRQEHSQREEVVGQAISSKIQKQSDCVETTSN